MQLYGYEKLAFEAWIGMEVGFGFGFKQIAKRSGLEQHRVRRAVRGLARKGLVEFNASNWTEDGEMCGAGYLLTMAGRAALSAPTRPNLKGGAE